MTKHFLTQPFSSSTVFYFASCVIWLWGIQKVSFQVVIEFTKLIRSTIPMIVKNLETKVFLLSLSVL